MSDINVRLRHTMLPVRDLDRTIDFYTRLLGMDIMRLRQQDETTRVGYLGYGSEDEGPALELVQSGGPTDPVQIPPWAGHFAIMVSDLYAFCEKLKAAGVTFTQEPRPNIREESRLPGREGKNVLEARGAEATHAGRALG